MPDHDAVWKCYEWHGGTDRYPPEEMQRLLDYHGQDTYILRCEGCGTGVHYGDAGHNEQVMGYVRFGPFFICAECIIDCVDLPELPDGWGDRDVEISDTDPGAESEPESDVER